MLDVMVFRSSESASLLATPEQLERARMALNADRSRIAALTLFARNMSHDMSNYMTVVRTYSELLLAELPVTGSAHADVTEIHRAAESMVQYMKRIGRFAQAAAARPGIVKLDEEIKAIVKKNAAAPRIRLELFSEAVVRIDADWLADSLNELIANAVEASPKNSTIEIRSSTEIVAAAMIDSGVPIEAGTWALLEVADSGNGIPEQLKSGALDPFVTTKSAERGAGFGLTLVRSAVWQAGGQLVLDGPNVRRAGTQVRIWLPIAAAT